MRRPIKNFSSSIWHRCRLTKSFVFKHASQPAYLRVNFTLDFYASPLFENQFSFTFDALDENGTHREKKASFRLAAIAVAAAATVVAHTTNIMSRFVIDPRCYGIGCRLFIFFRVLFSRVIINLTICLFFIHQLESFFSFWKSLWWNRKDYWNSSRTQARN